ncbi:hypothetical protein OIU34_23645 [Pararhizobium sp. BT-229]|uniref:hypothetical protein n=1 Tax=Pararhizobium sp. BT-229 TaxID=2986923 RepID=UPI0021F7075B|nr:hypothetical protein [Pararhizobium sp. BT-229]MCV9964891.1 hypothetical protein [Pararhizobium sp. BT-229]
MPKQSQSNKKLAELETLETSVGHVRDLMAGNKALGLDFALSSSLAKFETAFSLAAAQKDQAGIRELTRLGQPSVEVCSALSVGFKEMQGAVLRKDQDKVNEITALFERSNVVGTLEGYLSSIRVGIDAQKQAEDRLAKANREKAIHLPRARPDMADVPADRFKHGFGFAEVDEWQPRLDAVGGVVALLESPSLPPPESSEGLRRVARIFATVSAADRPDWYSLARFLGHPSSVHCRDMTNALFSLAAAVDIGHAEAFNDYRSICNKGYVCDMLDNYLSLAGGGEYVPEVGAVYIAWSSADRSTLQIGVAYDQIEEEIRRLDRELELPHRHGVLASWLVHDVDEATATISSKLSDRHQADRGYQIRLIDAKSEIQAVLDATANTVLSPWHGEELEPVAAPSLKVG